ncbi:Cilia- and flagella-associated protein 161 [Clonorchis sinensis]|uniref:Cilia- and flagella-associated protein 161 n=1 Tax=Clonorchis sinensis TaxID=79923 RepID=A0A419Q3A0_CLOSI|nr:Cilia- and flagella-associated protein 161 [Clonorchis sinensis]
MSEGLYSSKTLVGPWQQQRQIEKDRLEDFLERCRKGQLAIQGMTELYQRFTETTPVKMSTDGCVRFCDSYVLLCPPSKPQYVELGWCNERPQTMLTADYEQCLAAGDMVVRDGNAVTAATCIQPIARSVFQIFSPQALPDDCVVTYGMPVQFRLANTNIGPERVYLASDNASPMSANRMSGHQRVFLTTDKDSFLTHWKIEHQHPDLRMESEGCPVKSDTLVLIKHCRTNAAIAVEDRFTKNLSFGQEYEVSCHTYLDGHRAEKDVNLFSLATIIPPNTS